MVDILEMKRENNFAAIFLTIKQGQHAHFFEFIYLQKLNSSVSDDEDTKVKNVIIMIMAKIH